MKKKITVSWSGGKDSAFALYKVLLSGEYEVMHLHTVMNEETKRVGMHGVREELIDRQAEAVGIPLRKIYLESSESHAAYENAMKLFYKQCAAQKISAVVFGDIFLEDLRKFRLELLKHSGLAAEFPIWGLNTNTLINDFIHSGFKTIICSANADFFCADQLGKTLDEQFISELPPSVDPCGENGEFHTFVYDGPVFRKPVAFRLGEVVMKTYPYTVINSGGQEQKIESSFWFQDVIDRYPVVE